MKDSEMAKEFQPNIKLGNMVEFYVETFIDIVNTIFK